MKTTAMPELPPGHQNHFSLAENCPKSKGVFQKSLAEPKYSWSGIQTHLELQPRKAHVVSQSSLSSPHFQGTENTQKTNTEDGGGGRKLSHSICFPLPMHPALFLHPLGCQCPPAPLWRLSTSWRQLPCCTGHCHSKGTPQLGQMRSVHFWWPQGWGQAGSVARKLPAAWNLAQQLRPRDGCPANEPGKRLRA